MRVEPEPRLRRLAALGALTGDHSRVRLAQRVRSALSEWRDIRNLIGLIIVATALIAVLMLVTMLCASIVLILLWYVLRWISLPLRFFGGTR